jgi:SAM-dependent methyltransferase
MTQRTDEWMRLDAGALQYHAAQWEAPKRSTIAFERFCRQELAASRHVIDLGAGSGAATAFLASSHRGTAFTAFDLSADLVEAGRSAAAAAGAHNLRFLQGDWYAYGSSEAFDGVVSLQTLSWLPEHESALQVVFDRIGPRWVGLSSLFYEGDISCRIEVHEHPRDRRSFYNVIALPALARLAERHGYVLERFEPFRIDVDLPRPADSDRMATYTRRVVDETGGEPERLQLSGPLLMSWYMVLLRRKDAAAGASAGRR